MEDTHLAPRSAPAAAAIEAILHKVAAALCNKVIK